MRHPIDRAGLDAPGMLRRMGGGFGALGLAGVLAGESGAGRRRAGARPATRANPLAPRPPHFAPRAKRVIFLFMNGGPSHVDTFDPKPMLDQARRRGRRPQSIKTGPEARRHADGLAVQVRASTAQSGIEVSELFPEVAGCIDDICVIRSMHTDIPNHEPVAADDELGQHAADPAEPGLVADLRPGHREPEPARLRRPLPGQAGRRPAALEQQLPAGHLPGDAHQQQDDRSRRRSSAHVSNRHLAAGRPARAARPAPAAERAAPGRARPATRSSRPASQSLEMAFRMQFEARDAFDIGREIAGDARPVRRGRVRRRLPDRPPAGRARACGSTQVYYGNGQPWDDHADITNHRNHAQKSDRPIAALLTDLKARGLLDETLVVWGGEFGRTPTSEGAKGRDHHSLRLHHVAGRRRRQGRPRPRRDRRARLRRRRGPGPRPRPARHDPAPAWASTTRS